MSMTQEFKKFAMRGNVVDLAVGVIIGIAFGKIVTSLVNDVIMPPIGLLISGERFRALEIVLREAAGDTPAVAIKYGIFANTIIEFLIIAIVLFLVVKAMNTLKKKEEEKPAPPPAPSQQEVLLTDIRDILKARS